MAPTLHSCIDKLNKSTQCFQTNLKCNFQKKCLYQENDFRITCHFQISLAQPFWIIVTCRVVLWFWLKIHHGYPNKLQFFKIEALGKFENTKNSTLKRTYFGYMYKRFCTCTGLTSQIHLHWEQRCKLNVWRRPGIEPIPLHCSVMDQSMTTFPFFQSQ